MAKVLVVGATIKCSHGGSLRLLSGNLQLQVDGNAVITFGMEAGLSFAIGAPGVISPCPIQTTSTPPAPSPCFATLPATGGVATKLMVGGTPVLLDSASGQTTNAQSPGTWSVADAGQNKLEAS